MITWYANINQIYGGYSIYANINQIYGLTLLVQDTVNLGIVKLNGVKVTI